MHHFHMRSLVPRPMREIVFATFDIQLLAKSKRANQTVDSFMQSKPGKQILHEAQLMTRGALQIALFAIGFYAIRYLGWSIVTTVALSSVLSTASMVIGASFYGLSFGARTLLHCIGTGSLWQFATGITLIGVSYYALENLEIFQIGFLEKFVKWGAENSAPVLINYLL